VQDLDLARDVRMVEPQVEAAALERVVHLAGAVRGEHDDRRDGGPHLAQLGDRHGVLGEHLEEEGLELVVRPVDLVDEQDGAGALQRPQDRPGEQEAPVVERGLDIVRCGQRRRSPPARAGAAAAVGSPSRRAPGKRRCPRSTAAGSARRPARSPAPARARSSRSPARPRRTTGGASPGRGTPRSPGRRQRGSRWRAARRREPWGSQVRSSTNSSMTFLGRGCQGCGASCLHHGVSILNCDEVREHFRFGNTRFDVIEP
jgi:hypothetical protein